MPRRMIGLICVSRAGASQLVVVLLVVLTIGGLSACSSTSTGTSGNAAATSTAAANTGGLTSTTETGNTGNTGTGDFCSTHTCIPNFPNGTGYIVQCADGEWSHSGGRPGACSDHGGETGNTPGNAGSGSPGNSGGSSSSSSSGSLGNSGSGSSSAAPPSEPTPTGQDSAGYNTGPSCSDDPNSPLPGCSDSPSTPNGDPNGSCPNGITVDAQTTTCGLAENVYSNYSSDGQVSATSPKTGHTITFDCQTGGSGTTGYTICVRHDGAVTLYLRWHK